MIERNYGPFLVKKEKRYYELNIIKFSTISVGLMNMGGLFCRVVAKFYKISYLLFLSFSFMSCLLNAFVDEKNHTIFKKFLGFGLLRIRKMGNWEKHVVVIKSLHYYYFLFFYFGFSSSISAMNHSNFNLHAFLVFTSPLAYNALFANIGLIGSIRMVISWPMRHSPRW